MAFFTTISVTIEAERFTYPPSPAFRNFVGEAMTHLRKERHPSAIGQADIILDENWFTGTIREGDWLVLDTDEEFHIVADYLFNSRYTPTP